jgi:EF-P beta-lysylation protein EpmB
MIPHTERHWQSPTWREELRLAYREPAALLAFLRLDPARLPDAADGSGEFPFLVPRPFARRMRPGDPADPLLLQVLPAKAEALSPPGYQSDPLGESAANPLPGLVHKYRNRALLIAASGCAVNCRYCFRRHFDYPGNRPATGDWHDALDYLGADPGIREVILSGGDPLLLGDSQLATLIERIAAIGHITRLRIHTRLPVVLPSRVTGSLCRILAATRLRCVVVIHCNHPAELDTDVHQALAELADAGVCLLNQSVLLAGVNDRADTLNELSERLFDAGVMPYYLHLLDRVHGAAHFDVPETRAAELYRELLATNSGYLVPRLVREIAGEPSKVPIACFPAPAGGGVVER